MATPKKNTPPESLQSTADSSHIVVTEDLINSTVDTLEVTLLDAIGRGGASEQFSVDLRAIKKIDARGISLLIGLKKECDKTGRPLAVEMANDVLKTFKTLNLTDYLGIREVGNA